MKSTAPYTLFMQRDIKPSLLKNNGNDSPVAIITKIETLYASPSYNMKTVTSYASPSYNIDTE